MNHVTKETKKPEDKDLRKKLSDSRLKIKNLNSEIERLNNIIKSQLSELNQLTEKGELLAQRNTILERSILAKEREVRRIKANISNLIPDAFTKEENSNKNGNPSEY